MAKRRKSSGFGSMTPDALKKERPVVINLEPETVPDSKAEPKKDKARSAPKQEPKKKSSQAVLSKTASSDANQPKWTDPEKSYKRMAFFIDTELRRKMKIMLATEDDIYQYQDQLINAALEEFFEKR